MLRFGRLFTLLFLLSSLSTSLARATSDGFPQSWMGKYAGKCTSTPPVEGVSRYRAEYRIAKKADSKSVMHWELTYITKNVPVVRPYELISVDPAAGHYVLDEKNGIKLDHYYSDGSLRSFFKVSDQMLALTETLSGSTLTLEILTYEAVPMRARNVSNVSSYRFKAVQNCVLERVENQ